MTGFYDVHLKRFNHKPSKKEIYSLLNKWEFTFEEKNGLSTIESGIDENLWLTTFGFIPKLFK